MVRTTTTRTLNPLPFGDLEPRRFEDLVRALAYVFRPWRTLEATGRSGSDRGFDGRGFEVVGRRGEASNDDPDDEAAPEQEDRLWLIQCKREKSITPTKVVRHLSEIEVDADAPPYGMIFAAACDFSIATRDAIRTWGRERGMSEVHVWGRGELEDQLLQPKNDHLLFAFFGISLAIRKRSDQGALRALLATERKCIRLLSGSAGKLILLRDFTDKRYPHLGVSNGPKPTEPEIRWRMFKFSEIMHEGLALRAKDHYAYLADDGESWDFVEIPNLALPFADENPWYAEHGEEDDRRSSEAWSVWNSLEAKNKFFRRCDRIVPFEAVLDIDEHGDQIAKCPHIYIANLADTAQTEFFLEGAGGSYDQRFVWCDPEKRTNFFASQLESLNEP